MKKTLLFMTCLSLFAGISYADEVEYYYKRVPIEYEETDDNVEYYYKKVPVKKVKKATEEVIENEPEYTYKKVGVRRKKEKQENTENKSNYFAIKGGLAKVKAETDYFEEVKDDQFIAGVAIGMKEHDFRGEIDVTYRHGKDLDSQNLSVMANAYYDIPLSEKIKPFINAGLGVSITKASIDYYYGSGYVYSEDETEFDFAWNVGAGISIQANENVNVDFALRHVDLGKIEATDFESNEFLFGIRIGF